MTCEELRLNLREVTQQEADLKEEIFSTQNYMWSVSDNAGLDDKYDAAAERCRVLESDLEKIQIERCKIVKAMEEQGCLPVDQA